MDDDFIVTTFVVVDKTMAALGHRDHLGTTCPAR
jgi:hypothetical protein